MENITKIDTIRPIIEEAFEQHKAFSFKPNGKSMQPFIKGGKTFVMIEKYTGNAKKYDIVFYTRDSGQYVLHRIVKIYEDGYGITGDNLWWIEKVKDEQIFAIVTEVNGKATNGSKVYLNTLFIRRFFVHVKMYLKKHLRGKRK